MASFTSNFEDALSIRAPELAQASTPAAVKAIVEDARSEAQKRTIPNTLVYQITVAVLGIAVLTVIGAQLWITLDTSGAEIPDGIIAIGSAAIGALAGLLAPPPSA
ncbi:hypothetical protein [Sphingosinicella sp. BN140058]|uniref:hypothetical protein n=1 Tax=Sphingosinicella sp. BN140058 TaxID=1892855 RepID=UPI001011C1ED|nr:hypothetical protein [Sphingosinicella sp. BN140058]QAY77809.1 hypothetical protein ETR14_15755 [Sphingosinicella sp. BN140058]